MNPHGNDVWDKEAAGFDDAPDHGLSDPRVRRAWARLLLPVIGSPPRRVADLGCGTGSLSVLLAQAGHVVTGMDFAAEMIRRARAKADREGVAVELLVGDASAPPLPRAAFDVVLSRHVLWVMPDPAAALARWNELLEAAGRLVLVEGRWSTGAGLTAEQCVDLVEQVRGHRPSVQRLDDPGYWGRPITDERFLVIG